MFFVFNNETSQFLSVLLTFLTCVLFGGCAKKSRRTIEKPVEEPHVSEPPAYDETQENLQTAEMKEDDFANVRLLTPMLPGGCNDENAAKEAASRHKSNQYFPNLEVQSRKIVNDTTPEELRRMVDELPPHPPQRIRSDSKEPSLEDRIAKWKDVHVAFHDVGIVYMVRSVDACRSKDDGPGDTIDSPSRGEEEEEKINSELPMSENKNESNVRSTPKVENKEKPAVSAHSSKNQVKEPKLAATQEETVNEGKTPKVMKVPSVRQAESIKSVNL
ncbi:unnamed protein product [Caenorhabditis sp. 36 PRJEB53466]|nr:unnamed protein product [Caenorhabditis sp. 36 PRJEB53466]